MARPSEISAYEAGWRAAAHWARRDDLVADIGSPAYARDREAALAKVLQARSEAASDDFPNGSRILHVLGQQFWHCPVMIDGTQAALLLLRDVIEQALAEESGRACKGGFLQNDGEGFAVEVNVRSAEQAAALPHAYHDVDLFTQGEGS